MKYAYLNINTGAEVTAQTRSIMRGSLPSTLYDSQNWNPIPRRPKRKSKLELVSAKYKRKQRLTTFQRKLVVFCYMGQCAPSKFTRKEHRILMRGMLPEILITASEMEVREEIVSVIQANIDVDLSKCGLFDFEFIDLCGKNASVPNLKPGTAINCRVMLEMGQCTFK